jgi:hypothetical protein
MEVFDLLPIAALSEVMRMNRRKEIPGEDPTRMMAQSVGFASGRTGRKKAGKRRLADQGNDFLTSPVKIEATTFGRHKGMRPRRRAAVLAWNHFPNAKQCHGVSGGRRPIRVYP